MKKAKKFELLKHPNLNSSSDTQLHNQDNIHSNAYSLEEHHEYLLNLLLDLDGVSQSPKYHPESDALYHTLQVFELAYNNSKDPELWLAALFHDVGKSVDSNLHAEIGAEMVNNLLSNRVIWLIEHHLDLIVSPRKTQQLLANTQQMQDLTKLREWDLAGRSTTAWVRSPDEALDRILSALISNK